MKQKTLVITAIAAVCMTFMLLPRMCLADLGAWTWMSGSDMGDQPGIYGTKGVSAATNVPGARSASVFLTDSSGNLWLFGGHGIDSTGQKGYLNDLWRYEPATKLWTWIGGPNWFNSYGIYGTKGTPAPVNGGPGARLGSSSWVDSSGNLWLFGGHGIDSTGQKAYLNDLWRYDTATGQWTWMSGSDMGDQPGIYGTKGVSAATNVPGARYGSVSWTDSSGNLWLFGGVVPHLPAKTDNFLNDLWRYDTATGQWTWMSGTNKSNQRGIYGTKGTPDAGNLPGARDNSISWTDSAGNLWLFGGLFVDSNGYWQLNDLWRYDMATGQWTWMSGSDIGDQPGIYGTKGVSAATNVPGARYRSASLTDSSDNLWLFGGSNGGYLNDLWRYEPDMSINKCSVKAGKIVGTDSIKFSGLLNATVADFTSAMSDNIVVTIEAEDILNLDLTTYRFQVTEASFTKGKYKSPKLKPANKTDPVTSLQIDTIKGTMKFSAKKVDLTGLSCPITIKIQIGDYTADTVLDEDIVNGIKKPCPPELMW